MPSLFKLSLAMVIAISGWSGKLSGQGIPGDDSIRKTALPPLSRQEMDRREAHRLFGIALLCEQANRLEEAARVLERAARRQPDAPELRKALIPLYLTLNRSADALAACRKVLDLDPSDYETWCLYARQLKAQGQGNEALAALSRAYSCPLLSKDSDTFLQIASELAALYEDRHEAQKALEAYGAMTKILKQNDAKLKLAEVYECMGRLRQSTKEFDKSLHELQRAQRIFRSEDPLRARRLSYDLALVHDARGSPADALRLLDDYLLTQPPGMEAYDLRAELLKKLGREREILQWMQTATDRDTHNLALRMRLAREYARQGRPLDAERTFQQLAAEAPAPEVYAELFNLYRQEKKTAEALKLLDTAMAHVKASGKEPGPATQAGAMVIALRGDRQLALSLVATARERLKKKTLAPETRRLLALLADAANQYDAAAEFYISYLADGANPQAEPLVYARLLEVLWATSQHEQIIKICRQGLMVAQSTNRALFHRHLARALFLTGKTEEALAEADQVVQLSNDQNRLRCRLFRAQLLSSAERFDAAESECLELLKEAAGNSSDIRDIRQTLSVIYSNARRFAKAEEQLELILKVAADDATANNDLGYLMADRGQNLERAEQLIRKAIKLDHDQKKQVASNEQEADSPNAAYIDSLGWVLFRRGRLLEARRELQKAVSLPEGKNDPAVWDHLGDVYSRMGDSLQAEESWRNALKLYETEKRRNLDSQYQALKRKLDSLSKDPPQ